MAIRKEAMAGKAFSALKAIYDDRKAVLTKWNAEGKKIVLVTGVDVPEEMILAAGMQPFQLTGYYGERPSAEKYLEYSFGPIWKGLWENILEGYKGLADYIVFSSSSDMNLKLFNYLRAMRICDKDVKVPEPKYIDLELVDRVYKAQERNERELEIFRAKLEQWSGNKVTDEAINEQIAIYNEYRDALREFAQLRKKDNCRVLGSEALVVIGGSMYMDKKEAAAAVKAVTEEAKNWPVVDLNRVYYVGSRQETTEVYDLAEECGCNIVGEDHDLGDRYYDHDVVKAYTPISALVERSMNRMPSSEKGSVKRRSVFVGEKLEETQADVLLTWMNKNDEAYVWDYPTLKKNVLDPKGIPSATIDMQVWPIADKDAVKAKLTEISVMKRKEQ